MICPSHTSPNGEYPTRIPDFYNYPNGASAFLRTLPIETRKGNQSMIIKERTKSKTHRIYESLAQRMYLSVKEYAYYRRLVAGYEGECSFDVLLRALICHCLILNDLQLQNGKAEFQVDTAMLKGGKLYVFEIKNFTGINEWHPLHFKRPGDFWYENPTLQLEKLKARLEIYLHNLGVDVEIEYRVVFVNPEFTLVGTEKIPEFVLPTEIPALLRELNQPATPVTQAERDLARKLIADHDAEYIGRKIPKYTQAMLRRGVLCPSCVSLGMALKGHGLTCYSCGHQISAQEGIRHSIAEYKLLFPEAKLTTSAITNWCGEVSSDRVYRALQGNYQAVGKNRARYYV